MSRRFPIGSECEGEGVNFRVWAPDRTRVDVVIDGSDHALQQEPNGYFCGRVRDAAAGTRYRFRLDGERETCPDPASRWQPDGPHGDSVVVDPSSFRWSADSWSVAEPRELVIEEIHIGTFTPDGTFAAAREKLPHLASMGINMLELMPVSEFPGEFGWGYDGVDLWAPYHVYGTPDDLRGLIDAAHAAGVAVILDVVYNHFGPDGCYLTRFTESYFTKKYENEWGTAVNFDGEQSRGVREFFVANARYWIEEFRMDGLRLDATQSIHDASERHVLAEISAAVRAAAGERHVFLVAENEPQDTRLITEYGIDAIWNDDWHHAARVALTGSREAYYFDYSGKPQEFVSMAKHGFLYQGQRYAWQSKRRGTPSLGLRPSNFVCSLENHDQVANSTFSWRLDRLSSPSRLRAMTALLLLSPQIPMLFQGEEFGSRAPFRYFADHRGDLAEAVAKGRREFLDQFESIAAVPHLLARPDVRATFEECKLDWNEAEGHGTTVALYRDLLRLRSEPPFFDPQLLDGAVLTETAFLLRWLGDVERLLIINLGSQTPLTIAPEPLLAPPRGTEWVMRWSSEAIEYGGGGAPDIESDGKWNIPPECAVLLAPAQTS